MAFKVCKKIKSLFFLKLAKCFQKAFFHLNGGACPSGHAQAQSACPPFKWKKAFWKHFECENSFCKKSRNLSWVGAGFSFKWLNFSKNAWNFALFEIWSGCRCDMKIIFGVFDNLDAKLLSNKIFWCWHSWSIWFWKCILHLWMSGDRKIYDDFWQ